MMDRRFADKAVRVTAGVERIGKARGRPFSAEDTCSRPIAWLDIGGCYNSGIANMRGLLQGYLVARAMAG